MYRITRYETTGISTGASAQRLVAYVDVDRTAVQRTFKLATGSNLTDDMVARIYRGERYVVRTPNGDTLIVDRTTTCA